MKPNAVQLVNQTPVAELDRRRAQVAELSDRVAVLERALVESIRHCGDVFTSRAMANYLTRVGRTLRVPGLPDLRR